MKDQWRIISENAGDETYTYYPSLPLAVAAAKRLKGQADIETLSPDNGVWWFVDRYVNGRKINVSSR